MRAMLSVTCGGQSTKGARIAQGPSKLFLAHFIEYVDLFLWRRLRQPAPGGAGGNGEAGQGVIVVGSIALAIWCYLLTARGAFWRCAERDDWEPKPLEPKPPESWPRVAAVVPARNEADGIGECVGALLGQDYPGPWTVILVD